MAIMLPSSVGYLLNQLGYVWPGANEDTMFDWGGQWRDFAGDAGEVAALAQSAADHVAGSNQGPAVEAFTTSFADVDGGKDVLDKLSTASNVVGAGLYLMGGVVIVLKIVVIAQLVALAIQIAAALAAAGPTFGASLGWIPIAKQLASKLIEMAINIALDQLLA